MSVLLTNFSRLSVGKELWSKDQSPSYTLRFSGECKVLGKLPITPMPQDANTPNTQPLCRMCRGSGNENFFVTDPGKFKLKSTVIVDKLTLLKTSILQISVINILCSKLV